MSDGPVRQRTAGSGPRDGLRPGVLWAVLGALRAFGLAVRVRHLATLGRHDVEALMASDRAGTTWLLGDPRTTTMTRP